MRIAVVALSCPLKPEAAEAVKAIVAARGDCELVIHPQCFLADGHFAGPDEARLAALREVMADPSVHAVWFARGGYGSNRIAEAALLDIPGAASAKTFMGYSDAGFLLAGFHKAGLNAVWGPMPLDVLLCRGGRACARRFGDGVQPDGALRPARDIIGARLCRRGSPDRGGERASLCDRPLAVPCDCEPGDPEGAPVAARKSQRRASERSRFRGRRDGNRRAMVRPIRHRLWRPRGHRTRRREPRGSVFTGKSLNFPLQ